VYCNVNLSLLTKLISSVFVGEWNYVDFKLHGAAIKIESYLLRNFVTWRIQCSLVQCFKVDREREEVLYGLTRRRNVDGWRYERNYSSLHFKDISATTNNYKLKRKRYYLEWHNVSVRIYFFYQIISHNKHKIWRYFFYLITAQILIVLTVNKNSSYIILYFKCKRNGIPWGITFLYLKQTFFIGLIMTVYGRNMYP